MQNTKQFNYHLQFLITDYNYPQYFHESFQLFLY